MSAPILEVKNLQTAFRTDDGEFFAVDDVSFAIESGKTLGIVGESGCGKSVTALSILRLIPDPPGKIVSGQILFKGKNLLDLSLHEMRKIRGNEVSMIFQEPMTSLNPVFTVGNQIMESIILHQALSKAAAREKAIEMLRLVGIPAPETRIDDYPHQMSGGMRQRIMIAMALSCNPKLLIADEPTTALDVTIQAQILDLLRSLREKLGMSVMLITHDLGVVAEVCDEVVVMYAGKVIERGPAREIFANPAHPYTRRLLQSIPSYKNKEQKRLQTIPGLVPNLAHLPVGCRFQDRCYKKQKKCESVHPPLTQLNEQHSIACYFPESGGV